MAVRWINSKTGAIQHQEYAKFYIKTRVTWSTKEYKVGDIYWRKIINSVN